MVYKNGCPNCARFVDGLRRTEAQNTVALVDVDTLRPDQRASLVAVPALITGGSVLYGTAAFEWLRKFDSQVELETFEGGGHGGSLAFSSWDDTQGYAMYDRGYSAFG